MRCPLNPYTDRLATIEDLLRQLLERATAADQRFFGVAEAATFTTLSEESIRRMLASGKLTALRPVRGRILIDRRQLEALILGATRRPATGRGRYNRPIQDET
jgi:excisionase family DNA binding protein